MGIEPTTNRYLQVFTVYSRQTWIFNQEKIGSYLINGRKWRFKEQHDEEYPRHIAPSPNKNRKHASSCSIIMPPWPPTHTHRYMGIFTNWIGWEPHISSHYKYSTVQYFRSLNFETYLNELFISVDICLLIVEDLWISMGWLVNWAFQEKETSSRWGRFPALVRWWTPTSTLV